ncbi:MAG: iron-sulfur cluster assembly accessory protein [Bacteroidota bacterium]|nr:iron-sulfur cluster assembly accessory protein [Bacteroidota bacterium]MXW82080.1 iron-sulfur cluster assembly accessory protein [Rhodothermaceae bacterium]MDE2827336.1 iron-sulfur cluster assembly accessory protein [Bacteroidota bacterium]MXX59906.1 iron-sulfur cluster assembly accessory protein [Rhodothermaceae bacterium]MXZ05562.1 iron-sulfur cluster assembly accessory protein [Rhodothermaceae bacterium]
MVDSSTAPVTLSPRAAEEVQKILTTKSIPEDYGLRVGVRGGGCSGMSYILGFDKLREHDITFNFDGIVLYIDKRQGLYLLGTMIDYHAGLDARGFVFNNPNATQTCGCGSSFAA